MAQLKRVSSALAHSATFRRAIVIGATYWTIGNADSRMYWKWLKYALDVLGTLVIACLVFWLGSGILLQFMLVDGFTL